MNPFEVLQRPVLSEKSNILRENDKYVFWVQLGADKTMIKEAVAKVFDVEVASVKTSVLRGKLKRRGMKLYRTGNRKKAIVSLKSGQKISLFEDQ